MDRFQNDCASSRSLNPWDKVICFEDGSVLFVLYVWVFWGGFLKQHAHHIFVNSYIYVDIFFILKNNIGSPIGIDLRSTQQQVATF